jgi:hypothetical protein
MKTLAFLLLLTAPVLAHAIEIHPGDSIADVQTALGSPSGQAQIDNTLTLYYDCGRVQVQFVDGKVTSSNLLSLENFAAPRAQPTIDDTQAARLRAERIAEGEALKAKTIADPNFTSTSAGAQLIFWQDFRVRYPDVSCDDEYKLALANWQADQQQIAEQQSTRPCSPDYYRSGGDYRQHRRPD